jgi:hypothetical protein
LKKFKSFLAEETYRRLLLKITTDGNGRGQQQENASMLLA